MNKKDQEHPFEGCTCRHDSPIDDCRECDREEEKASPAMLDALKLTADNLRHLRSTTSAYDVWLKVVDEAISKAVGK